ncbi:MAG: hypothetical protein OXK82_02590, partial [Deltaproteobacteria bacterium]|nr:hypothetical protein [Deltaproteobacteria bacterium]
LVKAEPEKSAVVLARTKAEARALSWLMRERVIGDRTDIKRAVIQVSRDLDGRVTEPLEIAVGDRLRIGATQWEKQLFNGTVVTVEDIEVRHDEGAAVTRKARNRQAAGRAERGAEAGDEFKAESGNELKAEPGDESPVHITARTDDGRRVTFRHDEIRDYHDNIRIDYGYAMTIASAQGLTVDRAFLLIDDRPSRETVYPAATRHREGIDVYVNRSPIVFDIAESRPEDEAERPVLDSDVRAYLAERWSRSRPKEAALDYVADGAWRDAREQAKLDRRVGSGNGVNRTQGTGHEDPGEGPEEAAAAVAAANDNAIVRIAQEIRHAVNGWRHGAAVDTFAAERAQVMAAWDELRRRARAEGETVALTPAFRETLDRHGALMKQAASFRRRPQVFERLLAERAGIGQGELEELRNQHARAGTYLRSVTARAAHRARLDTQRQDAQRQDAERQDAERQEVVHEEEGIAEAVAAEVAVPTAYPAPDEVLPPQTSDAAAPGPERDAPADWRSLYRELQRDWNDLVARSQEPDLPLLLMDGYDALIRRVRALADHPALSERARSVIDELIEYHDDETAAQETAEGYLAAAERHVEAYKALENHAGERGLPIARLDAWPEWREAAEMLAATGEAVLVNDDRYGAYLDAMTIGRERAQLAMEQLRNRLDENRERAAKTEVSQRRREPTPRHEEGFAHRLADDRQPRNPPRPAEEGKRQGFAHTLDRPPAKPVDPSERQKGFAHVLDDPEKLRELREKAEQRDRRLGRHMRRSRGLSM